MIKNEEDWMKRKKKEGLIDQNHFFDACQVVDAEKVQFDSLRNQSVDKKEQKIAKLEAADRKRERERRAEERRKTDEKKERKEEESQKRTGRKPFYERVMEQTEESHKRHNKISAPIPPEGRKRRRGSTPVPPDYLERGRGYRKRERARGSLPEDPSPIRTNEYRKKNHSDEENPSPERKSGRGRDRNEKWETWIVKDEGRNSESKSNCGNWMDDDFRKSWRGESWKIQIRKPEKEVMKKPVETKEASGNPEKNEKIDVPEEKKRKKAQEMQNSEEEGKQKREKRQDENGKMTADQKQKPKKEDKGEVKNSAKGQGSGGGSAANSEKGGEEPEIHTKLVQNDNEKGGSKMCHDKCVSTEFDTNTSPNLDHFLRYRKHLLDALDRSRLELEAELEKERDQN